ncbi:unnamed protein product [Brassica napus]|uniref:(rape) hypothetical protein n=1 Tax=Brassica napus TaxID=3708 RepID=A0A817AW68_BRANA|nr:unnamed protein product [Brassica napus]
MPSKCWCGVGITELISKTNQSPYHSYYRCIYAASLRNDNHVSNGLMKLSPMRYNSWTTKFEC